MTDPINLEQARKEREPHHKGNAVCLKCGHRWAAVVHQDDDTMALECPACNAGRGVMDNNFSFGGGYTIYTCRECLNTLWQISDAGDALCIKCANISHQFNFGNSDD